MPAAYKAIFFFVLCAVVVWGGWYAFRYFNKKIKAAETGWSILGWSVLFFLVCGGLFFGGLALLTYGYVFIAGDK